MSQGPYTIADTDNVQFERLGHPGKFTEVSVVEGAGIMEFTGSMYGYSAIIVSGSYSGDIELSDGGIIANVSDSLTNGVLYEFSIKKVSGGASTVGGVYVFKRQQ